jgi:hypothetical protein
MTKTVCDGCKYNDKKKAKEMFFTNFCTLWDCQITDRKSCKYHQKLINQYIPNNHQV